jgi:arsenate reductase (thioredoxin)
MEGRGCGEPANGATLDLTEGGRVWDRGHVEEMKKGRVKVLFVCIGNACRSPMAEAIARRDHEDVMEVCSAGLAPLGRVEEMTKRTLADNGYPSEGLESKKIFLQTFEEADLVVNMSGREKGIAFDDPSKVEDWQVEDPYGEDAEVYQRIFKDIEKRVGKLAEQLRRARSGGTPARKIRGKETRER